MRAFYFILTALVLSGALALPANIKFDELKDDSSNAHLQRKPRTPILKSRVNEVEQDIPGRDAAAVLNIFVSLNSDSSLNVLISHKKYMQLREQAFMEHDSLGHKEFFDNFLRPMEDKFKLRFPDMINDRRDYFIPFSRVGEIGDGGYFMVEWKTRNNLLENEWKDYAVTLWEFYTGPDITLPKLGVLRWRYPFNFRTHFDTVIQAHVAQKIIGGEVTANNWGVVHDPALYKRLQQ